jgi:hypothetical protein
LFDIVKREKHETLLARAPSGEYATSLLVRSVRTNVLKQALADRTTESSLSKSMQLTEAGDRAHACLSVPS